MPRVAAVLVLLVLAAAGCGSGEKAAAPRPDTGGSETASAGFFVADDTAAINNASADAQKAGTKARAKASLKRCNRAGSSEGYQAWRTCWHALLDPYQGSLNGLAKELSSLATHDLPDDCVSNLGKAAHTYAGFATKVKGLAAGIDSDQRAQQVKTLGKYAAVLDGITADYSKPFAELTQVCYSPKDMASINASPTPTPGG